MAWLKREQFLEMGLRILAESGADSLTILHLCERLGVTKGSFYHHFGNLRGFTGALLEYWESQHNDRLIEISRQEPEPMYQVPVLTKIATELPHSTEAAIRAWGKSNVEVAAVQARVDETRAQRILEVIVSVGVDKAKAAMLTELAVCLLVGFQHREDVEPAHLRAMLDEVNRLIYLEASAD